MAETKNFAVRVPTRREFIYHGIPAAEIPNDGPTDYYIGDIDRAGPDGRPRIVRQHNGWNLGTILTPLIVKPPIEMHDIEGLRDSETGADYVRSILDQPDGEATVITLALPEIVDLSPVARMVMATLNNVHDGMPLISGPATQPA